MFPAIKLQASKPPFPKSSRVFSINHHRNSSLCCYERRQESLDLPFSSLSLTSASHSSSSLVPSVASPPRPHLAHWNLNHRHIHLLSAIACTAAISASWLFFSAIPALLAFKRAAESLEKLLDVTREELPDTMAAVRLSGMEISDLTMELSDLGQEITQGVRNSTKAVRLAEDRLRRLTSMAPTELVQEQVTLKTKTMDPVIARKARSLREGIVKGRGLFQVLFSLTRFSGWAMNYMAARRKKQ